jgi:hypothetical protein
MLNTALAVAQRIARLLAIVVPLLLTILGLMWLLNSSHAHAAEQIPCWKAQALLVWSGGNESKAEKLAQKHGYTKAQIAEVRQRCNL